MFNSGYFLCSCCGKPAIVLEMNCKHLSVQHRHLDFSFASHYSEILGEFYIVPLCENHQDFQCGELRINLTQQVKKKLSEKFDSQLDSIRSVEIE